MHLVHVICTHLPHNLLYPNPTNLGPHAPSHC